MNARQQFDLMMWHWAEIGQRIKDFQFSPTEETKRVLMETLERYQREAERGRFCPSEEFRRVVR